MLVDDTCDYSPFAIIVNFLYMFKKKNYECVPDITISFPKYKYLSKIISTICVNLLRFALGF